MKTLDSDEVMLAARGGDDAWVRADVAQALYDALKGIVDSGSWYPSALEIDLYRKNAQDGEQLESDSRAALAAADGDDK